MEEELYYIWNGSYVGNAMMWWAEGDKGYTSDISKAGKYTRERAERRTSDRNRSDKAFPVSYIDGNEAAKKTIIDAQHVDRSMILKTEES